MNERTEQLIDAVKGLDSAIMELRETVEGLKCKVEKLGEENDWNLCVKRVKYDGTIIVDVRKPISNIETAQHVEPSKPRQMTAEQEYKGKLLSTLIDLQECGVIRKVVK